MNYGMVRYVLGFMMLFEGGFMIAPAVISASGNEPCQKAFYITLAVLFLLGTLLVIKKPKSNLIYASEGFVIVSLSWIIMSVFGALPFYLSGEVPSYADAFFETVSGFTTTGSTILTDIERLSDGLLFWRSFTHWVGGMGVLVLMLAILPLAGGRGMFLMRAEAPGPSVGKLVPKMHITALILYGIYVVMTVVEILLLYFGGMPLFDSFINAFSTAGTGGFNHKNASIAYYNSAYIEMVISIFMCLFGVNFSIFHLILLGRVKQALKSEELRWYFGIIAVTVAIITISILPLYSTFSEAFRYSFFQVSSVISTTGFSTADYNTWPDISKFILILLMFVGGCAGSTGGGIKVSRIILLLKNSVSEIRRQLHPRSVHAITFDKKTVPDEVIRSANGYLVFYFIVLLLSSLLISFDNMGFETTVTSVITTLNNVGPGLDKVGPVGNFSGFSWHSKLVLCADMLIGRLEVFPMLILFSPRVWRRR